MPLAVRRAVKFISRLTVSLTLLAPAAASYADAPATAPTTTADLPDAPAQVTPAAQQLLDRVRVAYAALKSLRVDATGQGHYEVDGQVSDEHAQFKSIFVPGKFRSEEVGNLIIGSDGKTIYVYSAKENAYQIFPAPRHRVYLSMLDAELGKVVQIQNQSLALALSRNAADELTDSVASISAGPEQTIDGKQMPTLHMQAETTVFTMTFDPQTYLLRRLSADISAGLRAQGARVVKTAIFTTDFTTVADSSIPDSAFAWIPPAGAKQQPSPPTLLNAAPPAFTLNTLDGSAVSSDSFKGHITVLDFWATWCVPCRASLPHLQSLYKKYSPAGVNFYAIDSGEPTADVANFVKTTNLQIPVLLDSDQKISGQFGTIDAGIPMTFIIGRDGVIQQIYLGLQPESEIAAAIDSALADK